MEKSQLLAKSHGTNLILVDDNTQLTYPNGTDYNDVEYSSEFPSVDKKSKKLSLEPIVANQSRRQESRSKAPPLRQPSQIRPPMISEGGSNLVNDLKQEEMKRDKLYTGTRLLEEVHQNNNRSNLETLKQANQTADNTTSSHGWKRNNIGHLNRDTESDFNF